MSSAEVGLLILFDSLFLGESLGEFLLTPVWSTEKTTLFNIAIQNRNCVVRDKIICLNRWWNEEFWVQGPARYPPSHRFTLIICELFTWRQMRGFRISFEIDGANVVRLDGACLLRLTRAADGLYCWFRGAKTRRGAIAWFILVLRVNTHGLVIRICDLTTMSRKFEFQKSQW